MFVYMYHVMFCDVSRLQLHSLGILTRPLQVRDPGKIMGPEELAMFRLAVANGH